MSHCRSCNGTLRCPRCDGRRGGLVQTPRKTAALAKARARRWLWTIGQPVRGANGIWSGVVVAIGAGRGPERRLTIEVRQHQGAPAVGVVPPYETILPASLVVRRKRDHDAPQG